MTTTTPRYPIYVISKGRWESRLTTKALTRMGVAHYLVVEPTEREQYARVIGKHATLLVLPFHDLGRGSIPARNWVWQHALDHEHRRHWILDDNIRAFYRVTRNRRWLCRRGTIFRAAEDFVERFENVPIAGFNYRAFVHRIHYYPPYYLNTRVYSCILIDNWLDLGERWRGRYNEDTDLSLRALKAGYCTILFNAFIIDKIGTMRMKGGNTDQLYAGDGRRTMAEELYAQHPDVTTIDRRWGRWQHVVDYSPFERNALRYRPGVREALRDVVNDYGMTLTLKGRVGKLSRFDEPEDASTCRSDATQ